MSIADTDIPKPDYWEAAVAHLMRRDRILKKIIPQHLSLIHIPRSGVQQPLHQELQKLHDR